jgi:hypothetical protein
MCSWLKIGISVTSHWKTERPDIILNAMSKFFSLYMRSELESAQKKGYSMFYHLGRIATRFRWLIVGLWMGAIFVSLPFAPQASSILRPGGFSSPDAQSQQAITVLQQKLHLDLTIVQVIFTSQKYSAYSSQFMQESQQALANIRDWSGGDGHHQLHG